MSDFTMYSDLIDSMFSHTEQKETSDCLCLDRYEEPSLNMSICPDCGACIGLSIFTYDYYQNYVKKPYQPYKRMSHFLKNVYSIRIKKQVIIPKTIIRFIKRKCKIITPNNI